MTEVLFPQMSAAEDVTGVVATWFVASGDEVTPATLIAEVAVDKVDAEVHAEASGIITLLVEENTAVRPGTVIARVT